MALTASETPPRPRRLKVRLEDIGDGFAFRLRNPQIATTAFLFLWLVGWTVGCVFLGFEAWNKPALGTVLFGIPFWSSWFFVAGLIVYYYTLYESFRLDQDGVTFYRQAIFVLLRREIPLGELTGFSTFEETHRSDDSTTTTYGIESRGLGRSLRFAANLPEAERTWLCHELQATLHRLQAEDRFGLAGGRFDPDLDNLHGDSMPQSPPLTAEPPVAQQEIILVAESRPLKPPSDSTWQLIDDFESVSFTERGRLSLAMVLGLTFICAFWNGIVSVFICVLWGQMPGGPPGGLEWWGMFVFLIPFEAIGLLIVGSLVLTLLEPVRTMNWTFSRDRIRCRLAWQRLFGWTWNYFTPGYGRLKVIDKQSRIRQFIPKNAGDDAGLQSALVVVDLDNTEICTLSHLSLGEARWMGDVLLQTHPEWFPRSVVE